MKRTGEIATTLTLISLGVILLGTLLGTNKTIQKTAQTILGHAQTTGPKCFDTVCQKTDVGKTNAKACGSAMICKNVSSSPIVDKYRCVVNLTPTCSGEKKECWCPETSPTITPVNGQTSSPILTVPLGRTSSAPPPFITANTQPSRIPTVLPSSIPTRAISTSPTPSPTPCFFQATAEVRDETGALIKDSGFLISSDKSSSKIPLQNGQYNLPKTDIAKVAGLKPNDITNVTLTVDQTASAIWELSDNVGSRYCTDKGDPAFGAPVACPQNAEGQSAKTTIAGIKLACGANPTYGWKLKRKPTGKVNVRVELSDGGNLSGNIPYNFIEFKHDVSKFSGSLKLTGINNGVTKMLPFAPQNGVINVTFDGIPVGQYTPSIAISKNLGSEYSDNKSGANWTKVPRHILEDRLFNELGTAITTLYITADSVPKLRIVYNTNPAAGIVYTSNSACQSCQTNTCTSPDKNECDTKSTGYISGWGTYWCSAKFKKNDNGDAIQQPSDFFKYCKDGEPAPKNGGGPSGCWCTNRTDCSKSAGKVEASEGYNYCRETNDTMCCVGGAKPSAEQLKPNRCCDNKNQCTQFGSNWSCSRSSKDCASGKMCAEQASSPTNTPGRPPAVPTTGSIPPTLAPGCNLPGFAEIKENIQALGNDCQVLVPGQEYSGKCGGNKDGVIPCSRFSRPVFKYEIDPKTGAKLSFLRCQNDQKCPETSIGSAPINIPDFITRPITDYPEHLRPILQVCQNAVEECRSCLSKGSETCQSSVIGKKCTDVVQRCSQALNTRSVTELIEKSKSIAAAGIGTAAIINTIRSCATCAGVVTCVSCIAELGFFVPLSAIESIGAPPIIKYIPERCRLYDPVTTRGCRNECYAPSRCLNKDGSEGGNYCCSLTATTPSGPIETRINETLALCHSKKSNCDACANEKDILACLEKNTNIGPDCYSGGIDCKESLAQIIHDYPQVDSASGHVAMTALGTKGCTELTTEGLIIIRELAKKGSILGIADAISKVGNCLNLVTDATEKLALGERSEHPFAMKTDIEVADNIGATITKVVYSICSAANSKCDSVEVLASQRTSAGIGLTSNFANTLQGGLLTCTVYFSNGKTAKCPAQKIPSDSLILIKTRVQSESLAENEITTGLIQSDINQDGNVNSIDYSLIVKNYGSSNVANVDINRDGEVNSLDMAIVITNLGQNTVQ